MLRYSFDMGKEADLLENAIKQVLAAGVRTADIMQEGATKVGTNEMTDKIIAALAELSKKQAA